MNKNLRKSYEVLDLPYTATEEEIGLRKNALIKIEKDKNNLQKIELIKQSAEMAIENIKKNGVPNDNHYFETSGESLITLFVVFAFCLMACVLSFLIF